MDVDVSLGRWFASRSALTPHRRALSFEGTTWSYQELQHRIDCVATNLQLGGVGHGDRVAFLGLNQPAFFEALFAASRLGAIFVPLNFRLTGPELAFIIGDAGIHTLVADAAHRGVIDSIRGDVPGPSVPDRRAGRRLGAAPGGATRRSVAPSRSTPTRSR